MKTAAVMYAAGLVGVTLDGRGLCAVFFLGVAATAAAVRTLGRAWQPQETPRGTGYFGE